MAVVSRTDQTISLLSYMIETIHANSTREFAVQQALCNAWQQCQLTVSGFNPRVIVGIPTTNVRLVDLGTMPPCDYWQRYVAVWQKVRQDSLPIASDVYYDVIVLPYKKNENKIYLLIDTAHIIKTRLQLLANAGLRVQAVDLCLFAMLRLLKPSATEQINHVLIKLLSEDDWITAFTQYYQQHVSRHNDPLRTLTVAPQLLNDLTQEHRKKLVTACGLAMHR